MSLNYGIKNEQIMWTILLILTNYISTYPKNVISCDSIKIKGYYVYEYLASEIKQSIENEKKRKAGAKSYSYIIDFHRSVFFIPFDSCMAYGGLHKVLERKKNFYSQQPYVFLKEDEDYYIERFCSSKVKIFPQPSTRVEMFDMVIKDDKTKKFAYRIKYIEGTALKAKIANNAFNTRFLQLTYHIDKSLEYFDCFFVYQIHLQSDFDKDILDKYWVELK